MQTSYVLDERRQIDGRRYVREVIVDDAGVTHASEYLAPASWGSAEYAAHLAAVASALADSLAESEFESILAED